MNRKYTIKDFDFLVILEIFEAISKNHSNNRKVTVMDIEFHIARLNWLAS